MQGKGLIRVFVIVLLLVCIYHLSFTFFTYRVENRAEEYAQEQVKLPIYADLPTDTIAKLIPELEVRYLDSVYNTPVLDLLVVSYTYEDLKKSQLGLGLDLSGGMSVTLQVSMDQLMLAMSDNSKDATFLAALEDARQMQKTANTDFITLFEQAYEKQANKKPLASIFATPSNDGKIKYTDTDAQVISVIRDEANAAFEKTVEIVRARVDGLGVANPNITAIALTQRIEIELPGIKNPTRARELLQSTAKLEFWETLDNSEVFEDFFSANEIVREFMGYVEDSVTIADSSTADANTAITPDSATVTTDGTDVVAGDSNLASLNSGDTSNALGSDTSALQSEDIAEARKKFPLYGTNVSLIIPNIGENAQGQRAPGGGALIGFSYGNNRAKVDRWLNDPQVRSSLPRNAKFLWSAKANEGGLYELYAIKMNSNSDEAPMGGDDVSTASRETDQTTGKPNVKMIMTSSGAQKWKRLTTANLGKSVAIVMDNKVYTAPTVQGVLSYESTITGNFTFREAEDLASIIRAGKLPAPAVIVEEAIVGSTLGKESIKAGLLSLLGGLLLVVAFMSIYYNKAGWLATLSLMLNIIFILGTLASLGAALTLPGIAGIVLTIGMAVDANVIIFERIKEELAKGKGMLTAISDGYSKSYSAIIDANITTLLTGFILSYFGVGPIRGFALILIIGIVSSLITAVLVSRLLMERFSKSGTMSFYINATKSVLTSANFQFIQKRKIAYIFSSVIIIIGIVSMVTRGFELGVDFQGGRSYQIRFDQPVSANDVKAALAINLEKASTSVKTFGDASLNQYKIVTSYLVEETGSSADSLVDAKIYESLKGFYKDTPTYENFNDNYKVAASKTGPTIAADIRSAAIYATIFSLIVIFLYILFRFRRAEFAIASLVTTAHDVLVLLSIFSIFKGILPFSLEVDQNFIAAILTVIGYSLNDTVIVFDRIREYLVEYPSKKVGEVTNLAVNSTLSRTLITSATTLFVVLVLFIFGGVAIQGFAFALLVGIGFGTYSSIFIAAPLVVDLQTRKKAKELKAATV
ncbi:protein translocase subunit SecDF [soil metagenome]